MSSQTKNIVTLSIAFTTGIAIGILFAPSKGFSKDDWKDCANALKDSLLTGVKELYREGESKKAKA